MRSTLLCVLAALTGCNDMMMVTPVDGGGGMDAGRTDGGGGGNDAGDAATSSDDAGPDSATIGDDAGMTLDDAGNPIVDAGYDAGMTMADAGYDAGPIGTDAGMPMVDAGYDAGPIDMDAGVDAGMTMIDAGMPRVDAGYDAGYDAGTMCTRPPEPNYVGGCNPTLGIECDGNWTGRCSPACTAAQCCSPLNNRFQCVARNADGSCPAPDLWVDPTRAAPVVSNATFTSTSCEMVEGCIAAPGNRRLLRFDTWTPNTGAADMYLGPPGTANGYFEYSSCHMHYHFNTYAEYELLTADGSCVAAEGHKQAFCLLDFYDYPCDDDTSTPAPRCSRLMGRGAYTCSNQGIRSGAQDVYYNGLDCQWIDITGVPAGSYLLRIRINTEHILNESNYANNEVLIPVTIP